MDLENPENPDDLTELASLVRTHIGRTPSSMTRIAAGLGERRFYRVHFREAQPASLIARIEPTTATSAQPEAHDPSVWLLEPLQEPLRHFLEAAGLRVPACFAHLPQHGIDLLEDLGDRTLRDVDGSQQIILYQKACEIVPRLQQLSANAEDIPAFGRIYDRALVRTKAWKWLHWTIPGLLQRPATEQESNSLQEVFESIAGLLDAAPRRFAHRDFKAENLHLVSEAAATAKSPDTTEQIVMIDLQGGFMAPPEYDLVCLLYDLQVELDETFMADCFAKTRMNLPDHCDADLVALRSDALATLRLCKDIAHLVYASRVRKDSRRWHEIPRGLTLLDQTTRRLRSVFPEIQGLQSILPTLTLAFDSLKSPQE